MPFQELFRPFSNLPKIHSQKGLAALGHVKASCFYSGSQVWRANFAMAEYRGGDEAEAGAVGCFCITILPETDSEFTPEIGHPFKRKVSFQPSMFRCYVSFREGIRP